MGDSRNGEENSRKRQREELDFPLEDSHFYHKRPRQGDYHFRGDYRPPTGEWFTPQKAMWNNPAQNPHAAQVVDNNPKAGYVSRFEGDGKKPEVKFSRVLSEDMPRVPYRRRTGETKTVIHWGQRKLLMSEIEFLTEHASESQWVIYAGAAPGTHINFLADMFPELQWVLVDPAPFSAKRTPSIDIRQEFFTDKMAEEFAGRNALFISDIRSADWQIISDEEVENDMRAQEKWLEIMKPSWSMFKFRLPWKPGKTTYLAGKVYLPVWGPITTTECRLVTPGGKKEYDNTMYEQQMFFFNTTMRPALYKHEISGEGLDHCYDCRAEIHILSEYLHKVKHVSESEIPPQVRSLSAKISQTLAASRTLSSPNSDPAERRKGILRRQYVGGTTPAYAAAKPSTAKGPQDNPAEAVSADDKNNWADFIKLPEKRSAPSSTPKEQRPKVEQTPTAPPISSAQTTLPEQQKKS